MKDLTDPTTIVEGLRLIAGVSDGPDPETGESYDTMNELMTNAANTLERLTAERDQARAEVEQMHARTDHATVELLALGRELRQAREERNLAIAEAAKLRSVLDSAELLERLADIEHERWSGWETYRSVCMNQGKGIHPSGERFAQRWKRLRETPYTQLTEAGKESDRIEARKSLAAIRQHLDASAPLATRAAAVLAAAEELVDTHEKFGRGEQSYQAENKVMSAVDAYRAALNDTT